MCYNKKKSASAFTLIEIVVVLAILALISVAVFGVTRSSVQSSVILADTQNRRQQILGLIELCNENFRRLPGNALFETRRSKDGQIELLFTDAPRAFTWGDQSAYGNTILTIQPQPGGLFSLVLTREKARDKTINSSSTEKVESTSLTLIKDFSDIKWRFFYVTTSQWLTEWTYHDLRPNLVELNLTQAGEETPTRAVFWLPDVKRQAAF